MPVEPRVFVVGAYLPNGGTYMAYHVGCILAQHFDYTPIAVQIGGEHAGNGIHRYDIDFDSVSISEMEMSISERDVLICNPSFSHYRFGLRLPGKKICYVQGFNTFHLLDKFDLYVSASDVICRMLNSIYEIRTRIINPFISADAFIAAPPWWSRPPGSIVTYTKGEPTFINFAIKRIDEIIQQTPRSISLGPVLSGIAVPQTELLRTIGENRHLLVLSPAEGFGLIPLEAMATGTVVVGFDGFGGRDYMRAGVNCATSPYPDIDSIAHNVINLLDSPSFAAGLAESARSTALQYSYQKFCQSWITELSEFLGQDIDRRRNAG